MSNVVSFGSAFGSTCSTHEAYSSSSRDTGMIVHEIRCLPWMHLQFSVVHSSWSSVPPYFGQGACRVDNTTVRVQWQAVKNCSPWRIDIGVIIYTNNETYGSSGGAKLNRVRRWFNDNWCLLMRQIFVDDSVVISLLRVSRLAATLLKKKILLTWNPWISQRSLFVTSCHKE